MLVTTRKNKTMGSTQTSSDLLLILKQRTARLLLPTPFQKVSGSILDSSCLNVEVSLGKMLNPRLIHNFVCVCACVHVCVCLSVHLYFMSKLALCLYT